MSESKLLTKEIPKVVDRWQFAAAVEHGIQKSINLPGGGRL
jgi:hypothetical protein